MWTVFVWVVFVRNILRDDTHSTGFKVVHSVLAAISVAFAVAGWIVVHRVRRRASSNQEPGRSAEAASSGPPAAGRGDLEATSPRP